MSSFSMQESKCGGVTSLELHGYLSTEAVCSFEAKVLELLRARKIFLVFDFSHNTLIASPGIASLIELVVKIQEEFLGKVTFAGLDSIKQKTFTMAGLLPSIPIAPTADLAADIIRPVASPRQP